MLKGKLNVVDAVAGIAKDQEDLDCRRGVLLSLAHCFSGIEVEENIVEKVGAIDGNAFNTGLIQGKDIFKSYYKTIFLENYKTNPAAIKDNSPLSSLETSLLILTIAALGDARTERFILSAINQFKQAKKQNRSALWSRSRQTLCAA